MQMAQQFKNFRKSEKPWKKFYSAIKNKKKDIAIYKNNEKSKKIFFMKFFQISFFCRIY